MKTRGRMLDTQAQQKRNGQRRPVLDAAAPRSDDLPDDAILGLAVVFQSQAVAVG